MTHPRSRRGAALEALALAAVFFLAPRAVLPRRAAGAPIVHVGAMPKGGECRMFA